MTRTAKDLAEAYYAGWKSGAWKNGQFDVELLDPERFRFSGPLEQHDNRETFMETLVNIVGPNLEMGEVHHPFVDGNDVCTIYDCLASPNTVPMAEWIHAENDRTRKSGFISTRAS